MVQYSKVCCLITQQSLGSSLSLDALSVMRLLDHLRSWYRSVPNAVVNEPDENVASDAKVRTEGHLPLAFFLQYEEALLLIHDLVRKTCSSGTTLIREMDGQIGHHQVSMLARHASSILHHRCVYVLKNKAPVAFLPICCLVCRTLILEQLVPVRPYQGILPSRSGCLEDRGRLPPRRQYERRLVDGTQKLCTFLGPIPIQLHSVRHTCEQNKHIFIA